jgi:type II secretory pathway predicted ATPase ExeA
MKYLNQNGTTCLYINVEAAQVFRENSAKAMRIILCEIALRENTHLKTKTLDSIWIEILEKSDEFALNHILTRWAEMDQQPKVLIIDEIDSLISDTLISVLRQLRSGYDKRPDSFPQSVILCGVRDVRDYRIHSSAEKTIITGGSAFNIKAESLNLGHFFQKEVIQFCEYHTQETGQIFTENAYEKIWEYSEGQPWIVNEAMWIGIQKYFNSKKNIVEKIFGFGAYDMGTF